MRIQSSPLESLEDELSIDAVALREKYRAERDKRLSPRGLGQYLEIKDQYQHYRDDPWADPEFNRNPLTDEVEVAIIGGGLGGLMLGAELRKAGVEDIRVIERGGDFGGVWYWNRYPGAACDTQAILYLPMLEELGYLPPRKFATQPEILAHWQRIAKKFDLYRNACFQTEVTGLDWDDDAGRWIISTNRGDAIRARYVNIALGPMESPKLPGILGLSSFKGHAFHTSRWDYDYTGGDTNGGLNKLSDKVVGIIGTGATAIQCIPHLGESARHLYVFQRTPPAVDIRGDDALDREWINSLGPGWQQRVMENFTTIVSGQMADEDLVNDGWTSIMANIKRLMARMQERGEPVENPMSLAQLADFMKMNEIREQVEAAIDDPESAKVLKPWYDRFCKRPCFSDNFLPSLNRPNVALVDTSETHGVERIIDNAVVVGGREYPVDCLIYSTGFEVGTPLAKRIAYEVSGRGGLTLNEKWVAGVATQHGIGTHGFPNLFIMSVTQTGVSLNFAHMIQEQARHIGYILGRAQREDIRRIEVTQAAEQAWCEEIDRAAVSQLAFQRECTPSYFNFEGELDRFNVRNSQYGGGPNRFYEILKQWREDGTMAGLALSRD